MRHYRDDIRVTQQVAGDTAKQALACTRVAETADHEEFRADVGTGGEHFLADAGSASADQVIVGLATVAFQITYDALDVFLALFDTSTLTFFICDSHGRVIASARLASTLSFQPIAA